MTRMDAKRIAPTEMDLLFVAADECLMSATYEQSGFAISLAFENYETACPPKKVVALLRDLSVLCAEMGGRIHLVKNLHVEKAVVRRMFEKTIGDFEAIKVHLDPRRRSSQSVLRQIVRIHRRVVRIRFASSACYVRICPPVFRER